MIVRNEFVIASAFNPKTGRRLLVEVTKLLLLEQLFYETDNALSDEVTPVKGWITIVGGKAYRVRQLPPEAVKADQNLAMFEVIVDWQDLETKPKEIQ